MQKHEAAALLGPCDAGETWTTLAVMGVFLAASRDAQELYGTGIKPRTDMF